MSQVIIIVGWIVAVGLIVWILKSQDMKFLGPLADPGTARALITLLVALSTIALAFLLVQHTLFSVGEDEQVANDRFRRGREIFAGLLGILGTIVGFYFGSVDKPTAALSIAELKAYENKVVTNITGGVPPYQFAVGTTLDKVVSQEKKASIDGSVEYAFDKKPEGRVIVAVTDARNNTAFKEKDFKEGGTQSGTPKPPDPDHKK